MHVHVHIQDPLPTWANLSRSPCSAAGQLLLCYYLVMVYITIDDLVLDHLSGHQ